jgi:hypothetical protein
LTVRIDDSKKELEYRDRYNKTFHVQPGASTVSIPMDMLITSGTNRKLDLKKVYQVLIFVARPSERTVLYFDYIRLTK